VGSADPSEISDRVDPPSVAGVQMHVVVEHRRVEFLHDRTFGGREKSVGGVDRGDSIARPPD
jgi:hypothetical protein